MNLDALVAKNAPTACEGILTAVGMSGAVIFGEAIGLPSLSPFAAFGAMIAMHITPRHGASARIAGALIGFLFLLLAASLSVAIADCHVFALIFLFILSWLAALPGKQLAYVSYVTKCAAVAVLLSFFDFTPSWGMGLYFCCGIIFGILISLTDMAFQKEDQQSALEQLRILLHGGINNPWRSLIIPATVVVSSLLAQMYAYSNPAWVGLTVIFVAALDNTLELKRLLERTIGTIVGAVISYLVLTHVHLPLQLALVVGVLAFFMPFSIRHYGIFSLLMTCIVLILIDIAMLANGGDINLLFWRCVDTVFGCLCVLAANIFLKLLDLRKRRSESI